MKVVREDAILRLLAELPARPSEARRASAVQERCRKELQARAGRMDRTQRVLHAAVAVLSAAYLSQLARMAFVLSW